MCGNAGARMRLVVIILGASLSLSACNRAEDPNTAGAKPAEAKPAPAATDTRLPSASAAPIAFATDSTVTSVQGTLAADNDAEFVIGEEKGTLLLVEVVAPSQDPKLTIHRADTGANLPDEHPNNVAHWIERLPDTVGYLIVVHKTGTATPFVLNLEKPRALFFDDRTLTAEVKLTVPANAVVSFVAPPSASIPGRPGRRAQRRVHHARWPRRWQGAVERGSEQALVQRRARKARRGRSPRAPGRHCR